MRKATMIFLSIFLCFALSGCGSSSQYEKAVDLMDTGDYAAAIEILEKITDYENSSEKLAECKYNLGSDAMNSEEWDTAINYFDSLDYNDSSELLKYCTREKGMHENADYDFLTTLQESILSRIQVAKSGDNDLTTAVNTELAYMEKFKNATFYDSNLQALAMEYVDGLSIQKDALKKEHEYEYQIEWQRGLVKRCDVLNTLYNQYEFLNDNVDFVGVYITQYDDQKNLLEAYDAIESDISTQTNSDNFEWTLDGHYLSCTITNNTSYQYSTVFDFYFYDSNNTMFESNSVYIEGIKPGSNYIVSVYIEDISRFDGSKSEWYNYYSDVKC
jgi:hypothetical protein